METSAKESSTALIFLPGHAKNVKMDTVCQVEFVKTHLLLVSKLGLQMAHVPNVKMDFSCRVISALTRNIKMTDAIRWLIAINVFTAREATMMLMESVFLTNKYPTLPAQP